MIVIMLLTYLFIYFEWNLPVVVLKQIMIFLICVYIKIALFSKLHELDTQAQENLFFRCKMPLGVCPLSFCTVDKYSFVSHVVWNPLYLRGVIFILFIFATFLCQKNWVVVDIYEILEFISGIGSYICVHLELVHVNLGWLNPFTLNRKTCQYLGPARVNIIELTKRK